ncbi:S1 family peptidase [Amycolatopsis anabasis]|uniref:S1 family peptidase n=1 Tax=Amycolatopsis anabasis TaxID=1840409 RepID=UPI00131D2C63|nr:serine protease [Amycolatopsis anabasis]
MTRRLLAALVTTLVSGTLVLAAGTIPAAAAPAQPAAADYTGIIKLSNCSGSLVRLPSSKDTDPALALTNGHCYEGGMPGPGEVIVNRASSRTMTLLGASGQSLGTLRAAKVAYATMTDTDVALYQLDSTYQAIASRLRGKALEISDQHPAAGSGISVVSGYFTRTWTCNIDKFVYQLREGDWTWKDSIRYTSTCDTIHGTSGSPVVDNATRKVVGVNNTGNDDGQRCTFNNPCEVDENGQVYYKQGLTYGQQTFWFAGCVSEGNKVDLAKPGCVLPKPARTAAAAA